MNRCKYRLTPEQRLLLKIKRLERKLRDEK